MAERVPGDRWDAAPAHPGPPFIIRWQSPHEAVVAAADGAALARLSLPPDGEPDFILLVEPAAAEERELLFRALVWAAEEHERNQAGG